MKEFSPEELVHLLVNKVNELKEEKQKTEELNSKLEDNMARLEEMQNELSTQRDILKEEVKQKTEELLKSERLSAIGQLAARIAHDLRNPLAIIQNSSKLLKLRLDGKLDIKSQQQLERIDRAIFRMSHQLEDVMDFVKMPQLKKRDYSLSLIIQDVVDRVTIPSNITIHPPQKDHLVYCDPEKMEIVFVNLFVNSIQAIGDKKGDINISIDDDALDKDSVEIRIKDNGCGIPNEIVSKIFDPLFTTKQVGTGLGLSSCKNIIDQHGGIISATDHLGEGATFSIKIPKKSEWGSLPKEESEKKKLVEKAPTT